MSYQSTLQAVDTQKALKALGLETTQQGSYIYFKCPDCGGKAVAKAWGDKKNLTHCIQEKKGGNIIQLAEKLKNKDILKGTMVTMTPLEREPSVKYELQYHDYLKEKGIAEDVAAFFGIGVPKGKSMLAGCVAFTVHNVKGTRVAYHGIRMKDGRSVFHHTYNPELYLYHYQGIIDFEKPVAFTTDIFESVRFWAANKQAVCNFGLPYLSPVQIELLNTFKLIEFHLKGDEIKEIGLQVMEKVTAFYRLV